MNTMTNTHNLPQSIVDALVKDTYDGPGANDPDVISVTSLISPPKIRILKLRHKDEIVEDVSDLIWRLFGSSFHTVIERAENKDSLVEERLTMKVGTKTLSGKTDIYQDGVIQDYKVTSVWSVLYEPEGKKEWTEQLNCLALLYRNAGFEVNKLQIIAVLRDHQASKAKVDPSYPQIPIVVIDVPLWEKKDQETFVRERVFVHSGYESMEDDRIDECTPEERWQSETTYAVIKEGNKRALKVFDNLADANAFLIQQNAVKASFNIQERPGEDKRCNSYCPVKQFCHHGRTLGQLQMEV